LWVASFVPVSRLPVGCTSDGISGDAAGFPRSHISLSWSQIKTCEIVTYYTRTGKPILTLPVFKDASGMELLSLDLIGVKMADQERLVKYLKTRLPKSPADSLEV
jgi:hypothetical protein